MSYSYFMLATMADAHREWHLNTGTPMGTAGCPQDACHPVWEFWEEEDDCVIRCGNRALHGDTPTYHLSVVDVRLCHGV